MNVVVENYLNSWFSLFILGGGEQVVCFVCCMLYDLYIAECLICTEHTKFNICYLSFIEVVSEMEDVLSPVFFECRRISNSAYKMVDDDKKNTSEYRKLNLQI